MVLIHGFLLYLTSIRLQDTRASESPRTAIGNREIQAGNPRNIDITVNACLKKTLINLMVMLQLVVTYYTAKGSGKIQAGNQKNIDITVNACLKKTLINLIVLW